MTATTFNILQAPKSAYRIEYVPSVSQMIKSRISSLILSILAINLDLILDFVTLLPLHVSLFLDCYSIQAKYYLWQVISYYVWELMKGVR